MKNSIKLGIVTILIVLLITAIFAIGYRAGSTNEGELNDTFAEHSTTSTDSDPTAKIEPTETTSFIQANPTSTLPPREPTVSPTPLLEPTATAEPVNEKVGQGTALDTEESLAVLQEVWDLIDAEFMGSLPSPEERAYGAIRGMLSTLEDEYTSFTEPSIAQIRRTDDSGSYEGIGAVVGMNEEDTLEIAQVFRESPAEKAGLRRGDQVLAVDNKSILGFGIYEAITLIRGPEGSTVVLTIQREELETFDVDIIRARLDIPIIESELLDNNIGYVSLFDFSSPATTRLQAAIEGVLNEGATALILDLRGNPGGFLDQAVRVADLFLDEGLVLTERRSDGEEIDFTSTSAGLAQDVPLVVLVNGGSASASEIVAGAIKDRGRGTLIGETTLGKGSVQLVHTLSDGSELRVTVARWFTPNDQAIHGEGLGPDIVVPLTLEDEEADRDPQLERAIEFLKSGE